MKPRETTEKKKKRTNNLRCKIHGHTLIEVKKITAYIKEYRCIRCAYEATTDVTGKNTILTPERKKINQTLEHIHNRKKNRDL